MIRCTPRQELTHKSTSLGQVLLPNAHFSPFCLTSLNMQSRSSFLVACFSDSLLITRTRWQGTYRNFLRTRTPDEVTLNANESYDKGSCCQDMLQSLPWKKDNALPRLITNNWHGFKLIQSKWWKHWMMFSFLFIGQFIMSNPSDRRYRWELSAGVQQPHPSEQGEFTPRWLMWLTGLCWVLRGFQEAY